MLATAAVIIFGPTDELTYQNFVRAIGFPMAVILPIIAILVGDERVRDANAAVADVHPGPTRGHMIGAKAIRAVAGRVGSVAGALAGGAGNVAGTAITGTPQVWDVSLVDAAYIVLGNVLGLLSGFTLGVLIRSSAGAIVAYFVYSLVLPSIAEVLAASQQWFTDLRPWVDVNYAQGALFAFDGLLTDDQWAQLGVTGVVWLLIPMAIGLRLVLRSEVK